MSSFAAASAQKFAFRAAPAKTVANKKIAQRSSRRVASLRVEAAKKSVGDLAKGDLEGQTVLIRCDFNVPLDGDMNITDDTRIRAAIPSIDYLVKNGAKVLACSHFGRPKSGPEDKFRLTPVGARLSELLSCPVTKIDDCIGPEVEKAVAGMSNGSVCLLENTRFYKEEEGNDAAFAKNLAGSAKIFVNDAFGTAHRAHASTAGVTGTCETNVAGFLLQKELDYLDGAVKNPERPFCAIVGGSKVSSKIVEGKRIEPVFLASLLRAMVMALCVSASVAWGFDPDARNVACLECQRQFGLEEKSSVRLHFCGSA
jgi:phosphoglycerate kinase